MNLSKMKKYDGLVLDVEEQFVFIEDAVTVVEKNECRLIETEIYRGQVSWAND
jgi:hypothetical protein